MDYISEANALPSNNLTLENLQRALNDKTVLFAKALVYDKSFGLRFNLGGYEAIMPFDEVSMAFDSNGIKEASISTRVNKNVCFIIDNICEVEGQTTIYISQKKAQEMAYTNYVSLLTPGDIIPCTVTHVDSFGIFCDVGFGITSLMPIDFISVSRIQSPHDRFVVGQNIFACVKAMSETGRLVLTHKELLGTWIENAQKFSPQTNAVGIVRSIENYGIFIELLPNLAGLAESCEGIKIGDIVNVYIKSILPDKMKIKLVILSTLKADSYNNEITYFQNSGKLTHWKYSTENCSKIIETIFN